MGEAKRRKQAGSYPDTTVPKLRPAPAVLDAVSWEVLGDLSSHPKATQVLELLERLKAQWTEFGGKTMVVTLESAPRMPLVKILVTGLGAFMDLVAELQDLGLEDRLEEAPGPERGIDAAFG